MKKLVVLLTVAAMAVVSYSATVSWSSGAFANGLTDPDGKTLAGSDYLASVYIYSDAAGANELFSKTEIAPNAITGAFSASWTGAAKSTEYYIKAIITGSQGTLESSVVSFTTKASGATSLNFVTGAGLSGSTAAWSTSDWQAVPEPTSAMLLLMGLAGLALKRKRA